MYRIDFWSHPFSAAVVVDPNNHGQSGNLNDASRDVNVNASTVLHPCIGRSSHIGILFAHRAVLVVGAVNEQRRG